MILAKRKQPFGIKNVFKHLHQTDAVVFTIFSAVKRAECHRSTTIIVKNNLIQRLCYLLYRWPAQLTVQVMCRISSMHQWANSVTSGATEADSDSPNSGKDCEYSGLSLVGIFDKLVMQDDFLRYNSIIWPTITSSTFYK